MPNTKTRNVWLAVGLSVLIGVGVWEGIGRVTGVEAWDHGAYWWLGYPLMIIAAGVLGFMFPRQPWRWGALIIGTQLIWSFIGAAGQAVLLPLTLLIFIALAIPCILASYIGAWMSRKIHPVS